MHAVKKLVLSPSAQIDQEDRNNTYEKTRRYLVSQLERISQRTGPAILEGEKRVAIYEQKRSITPKERPELSAKLGGAASLNNARFILEGQLEFLRPISMEDKDYRLRVLKELPSILENVDQNLRFHGTSIYHARSIIFNGNISSSEDRIGIKTSYDIPGFISVTAPPNAWITIQGYTGLTELDFHVPAGCIFVIKASDRDMHSLTMENVDFKDSPKSLVAVLASPEMIGKVQGWLSAAGMNPSLAMEFLKFAQRT